MPQTSELLWPIVLITVFGVGALLIALVLRAFRNRLRDQTPAEAFTIQELREMLEAGDITQREFEAMRAAIVGRTAAESPPARAAQPAREPKDEHDAGGAKSDSAGDDKD